MRRSIIASILILCLLLSTVSVFATDNTVYEMIPEFSNGIVIDQYGNEYEVIGKLVDTPILVSNNDVDTFAATYEYEIDLASTDPSLNIDGVFDSTYSVKAYNTIYWKTTQGSRGTAYCLTKVTGSWIIQDNTVSVSNCMLRYGCTGYGTVNPSTTQRNEIASVSNNFSRNTGFTGYVYSEGGVMGSNMTLTLRRGTNSVWTLYVENNLFGVGSFW